MPLCSVCLFGQEGKKPGERQEVAGGQRAACMHSPCPVAKWVRRKAAGLPGGLSGRGRSWGGTEETVLEPRPPCQRSGQQVGPTQGASGPVQAGQREEMLNSKRTSMAAARVREAGLLPSSPQHAERGKPRGVEKGGAPGPCPLCALRQGYSEISGFVPKVQKL